MIGFSNRVLNEWFQKVWQNITIRFLADFTTKPIDWKQTWCENWPWSGKLVDKNSGSLGQSSRSYRKSPSELAVINSSTCRRHQLSAACNRRCRQDVASEASWSEQRVRSWYNWHIGGLRPHLIPLFFNLKEKTDDKIRTFTPERTLYIDTAGFFYSYAKPFPILKCFLGVQIQKL